MKKHTILLLSVISISLTIMSLCATSCKKSSNSTTDSGTFYFHLHTNIADSTIADSLTYYPDTLGRYLALTVPQFFISNVMLINASGNMVSMGNVHILKGLDSEDYVIGKAPVGTYIAAMFNVGLDATTNALPPTTNFTPNSWLPESGMWYGSTSMGYMAMKVQGMYDTTATHSKLNPINFSFEIPNSMTSSASITLPNRGTGAWAGYPIYVLTKGGTQYVHIICDYAKLLSVLNLKTQNITDGMNTNVSIATALAAQVPNMFRYEQ